VGAASERVTSVRRMACVGRYIVVWEDGGFKESIVYGIGKRGNGIGKRGNGIGKRGNGTGKRVYGTGKRVDGRWRVYSRRADGGICTDWRRHGGR